MSPELKAELYQALKRLDAQAELLAIVGSIGDTLSEEEALALLREFNETGRVTQATN